MSSQNKQKGKLPDKKKNDLLKKFLNAQQYTKTLKKNASNLIQQNSYAAFSYDEFQTYPQIPQSAKLPSTKLSLFQQSCEQIHSIETLGNDSNEYSIKAKSKKSHDHIKLTQSSSEIPYLKSKKSSYSQVEKSQSGGNAMREQREQGVKINKDFDVHSVDKQKHHQTEVLHESLGGMKTESFFKLKSKKSFNFSNAHEYESEKLSGQDHKYSYQRLNRKAKRLQGSQTDLVRQDTPLQPQAISPYSLTSANFAKLLIKIQQLSSIISLYQTAIGQMKRKLIEQQLTIKTQRMAQIYVDVLKEELMEETMRNAELRERLEVREGFITEYEKVVMEVVEGVAKHYEKEMGKIVGLEKENAFLKFMMRLEIEQEGNNSVAINKNKCNDNIKLHEQKDTDIEDESIKKEEYNIKISKNMTELKDKFTKLLGEKEKQKNN